jgi:PBSX family phage terminase large subunit
MAQLKFSPKQMKFMDESTAKINIAHGAVRSGKSHISLYRFGELVINCPNNEIIMIGNSFSSIVDNGVRPLCDTLFPGYCAWQPGNKKLLFGDKIITIVGASDEGSIRRIQGNTHSLSYVDELTTIPYNFVDMLTTRLSHSWSKLVATCNPNSPSHPVKTNLIDNPDKEYCYNLHFDVDDNPYLDEKVKYDLKKQYTGLFYRRYILGEWVAAEGSIYADFSRATHVLPRAPHFADNYFVGVDYGIHNAFAAVMVGHSNSRTPHLWVEKEFYWDSKKMFRQKLNSELADDLEQFIEGYNVRGIYLDPSAESFEVELKRRRMRVIQAKNDVYPGITFMANLISNHELKIVKDCPNLISEMEQYVWDAKKAEQGDEEPVKKFDHSLDALRYCVFTVFGTKRSLKYGENIDDGRTLGSRF